MKLRSQWVAFAFAGFTGASFPTQGSGGAWTPPAGEGVFISKVEYVTANAQFDGSGAPAAGEFYKMHVEGYGEYGLSDWFTLVGQVDYDLSWLNTEGEPAISEGFGRFGIWGRTRLWSGKADVASVQAGIELPGDRSGLNAPVLGAEPGSISVRGLWGRGYSSEWGPGFLDVQAGFLLRDEDAPTQAELDLTAGHWVLDDVMALAQLFNTYSLDYRMYDPLDYDQSKASFAAGWRVSDQSTVLLGVSADVATRNLEPTKSVFLSLWRNF